MTTAAIQNHVSIDNDMKQLLEAVVAAAGSSATDQTARDAAIAAQATADLAQTAAAAKTVVINTQTADYTLVLTDAGKCVEMNITTTANNLTVPLNATVAFPVGTVISLRQEGSGVTTIVATGGVTINKPRTLVFANQYGTATLHKRATNEWCVDGDLT